MAKLFKFVDLFAVLLEDPVIYYNNAAPKYFDVFISELPPGPVALFFKAPQSWRSSYPEGGFSFRQKALHSIACLSS